MAPSTVLNVYSTSRVFLCMTLVTTAPYLDIHVNDAQRVDMLQCFQKPFDHTRCLALCPAAVNSHSVQQLSARQTDRGQGTVIWSLHCSSVILCILMPHSVQYIKKDMYSSVR